MSLPVSLGGDMLFIGHFNHGLIMERGMSFVFIMDMFYKEKNPMIKRTWHVPVLVVLSAMLVLSACGSENTVKVFPFSVEKDAKSFDALTVGFKEQYPDIQFIDATAGIGPGVEPHLVLDTLLQSGNPPDSWQGYAGQARLFRIIWGILMWKVVRTKGPLSLSIWPLSREHPKRRKLDLDQNRESASSADHP